MADEQSGAKVIRFPRSARTVVAPDAPEVRIAQDQLDLLVGLMRGSSPQAPPAPLPGKTFGELAADWFETVSGGRVCPENELRHIEHMMPLWQLDQDELTVKVIAGLWAKLRAPAGRLGPSTLNKLRSTGKRIIEAAQIEKEWGTYNPFALLKRVREAKKVYPTLTVDEILRLLPFLRPDRRAFTKVALIIGCRPGEALGLRKVDVDLDRRVVRIRRSHGRDQTKTGKEREFPIPEVVLQDLTEAIRSSPGEYVFPRRDGSRQREDTKFARILRTAMGRAGIVTGHEYACRRKGCGRREVGGAAPEERWCPVCHFKLWRVPIPKQVRFYDLRHSSATLHRQAGADPLAVKLLLGHAMQDPTDDTYTHLNEEFMRKELNKLKLETKPPPEAGKPGEADPERRKGFEPSTPSLGSSGSGVGSQATSGSGPAVDSDHLLNVAEVARFLGCSEKKVYQLAEAREIPPVHVGSALRFEPTVITAFVSRGGAR